MSSRNIKDINIKLQTARRLMTNLIVKQVKRAYDNETVESIKAYDAYYNAYNKTDLITDYMEWSEGEVRKAFPLATQSEIDHMTKYGVINAMSESLPKADIDRLMTAKREYIIDNYVELNEYYRMLLGLPTLEDMTKRNFIYYEGTPVHELDYTTKARLRRNGTLDQLFNDNTDKTYIKYIGREIDILTARESEEFEILHNPRDRSDYEVYAICYNKEREVWMNGSYNAYLMYNTDFFEAEELVALKLRALIVYELETRKPAAHKSAYTVEEAATIWKEHGLVLPKNMPELYRNSCTFVLNYLLMFKGTNHVVQYITEKLFTGLQLYKYFIRKIPKENLNYPLTGNETPEELYDVEFVLRPFRDVTPYEDTGVTIEDKILSYDDVVRMDPRWRDTDELKKAVYSEDFSYVESKYLSLGSSINITKFGQWYAIMNRYIMENRKAAESQNIKLKATSETHTFFAAFIYYLALVSFSANRYHLFETDTIAEIDKLYGFTIPPNFDEIKMWWVSEFNAREFKFVLDNFPDALNSNSTFIEMLVAMEKAMGLHDIFDKLRRKVRNVREYKVLMEVERIIRNVDRVPGTFGQTPGSEVATTYAKILEDLDPILYSEYDRITAPFFITNPTEEEISKRENLPIELDNITTELIAFLRELNRTSSPDSIRMETVLDTSQRFLSGLSKFLLYILKSFKAYSVDFISEGGLLKMGPDEEFQLNFDTIVTHVKYNINKRMNIGSNDRIKLRYLKPIAVTIQENHDQLRISSIYGDVKVYDAETCGHIRRRGF